MGSLRRACSYGIHGPCHALMTARIPDDAQGELQGAISSLMGLTMIAAPLVMTQLFYAFTAPDALIHLPGAPYLAATLLMLLSAVLLRFHTRGAADCRY